jgi:hypothetical protein
MIRRIRPWLLLLALLGAVALAGCAFKAGNDDDGGSSISAGPTGDDDDKDSPGASLGAVLSVLGAAAFARRRSA